MEGGLGEGRPYSFKLSQSSPSIQIALRTSSSISVSLVKTSRLLAHTDGELCTRHLIPMKDVTRWVTLIMYVATLDRDFVLLWNILLAYFGFIVFIFARSMFNAAADGLHVHSLTKGPFIATQLNSTSSWVELSTCRYKRALSRTRSRNVKHNIDKEVHNARSLTL